MIERRLGSGTPAKGSLGISPGPITSPEPSVTIQVTVPPTRAGCWRVCKTRAQPPRPPVRREARADVRLFSNLGLLSRSDVYESGYVEWDVDTVFEEPEPEPCLPSRSSPNRAARPALGNTRPPPSRTVAQALMLPHALPVVYGTLEEAKAGLPTRAAATPPQAAIAPSAPEPSIDTAQFRARVAVTPAHRGAHSCARAHSSIFTVIDGH
jgi:hypothetical protein